MSAWQRAGAPAGTRIGVVCAMLGNRQTEACLGMDSVYHRARHRCGFGLGAHRVVPAALGGGDGVIINDKFCLTRRGHLHLSWWRRALRQRPVSYSRGVSAESPSPGGSHATAMDSAPDLSAPSGRTTTLGPGLPATARRDQPRRPKGKPNGAPQTSRMAQILGFPPLRPPPGNNSSAFRPIALAAGPHRCFRGDLVRGGGVGSRHLDAGAPYDNERQTGRWRSAATLLRTG